MSSGSPKKREDLYGELEREVRRLSVGSISFFQAVAERTGISLNDLQCMNILTLTGPITAGRLAELTGLTTGAITGVVDRLERAGHVRREKDPDDRRRVVIRPLIEKMEREGAPVFESMGRAWGELISGYEDRDLAMFLGLMRKMSEMTLEETARLREERGEKGEGGAFAAPLGTLESGRLVFVAGASRVVLRGDPALAELYHARFEGPAPDVREEGGTVTIRYPRRFRPLEWRQRSAEISLNASVPWRVEIRGGASEIKADLGGIELSSLEIKGGASRLEVSLPEPTGAVPVRLSGGASEVTIRHPADAAVRLALRGGASRLAFDGQRFGALAGKVSLQSPGYEEDITNRYELEVSGGASSLTLESLRP